MALVPMAQASAIAPQKINPGLAAEIEAWSHSDMSSNQWGLEAIRASTAWRTSTGAGTTVAVIDTGLDMTHPDLAGQTVSAGYVWQFGTENGRTVGRLRPATATPGLVQQLDLIGHGTHVAGVIAGNPNGEGITGVAPGARVIPINLAAALTESTKMSRFATATQRPSMPRFETAPA